MEKVERAIAILYDLTERQVEELSVSEFNGYAKESAFVLTPKIPGKPVRQIKVGKRRYSIIYDPTKLRHRQYVEIIHFGDRPIENMHLIMASVVQPVTWYGKRLKNEAEDHPAIASDLLGARVIDVYHTCVFFCKLFANLISSIRVYLVTQMMMEGMRKEDAMMLVDSSRSAMDGFIPPNR